MTRCEAFYRKAKSFLEEQDREGLEDFCQKDANSTICRITNYVDFCDRHELPMGKVAERALRPLIEESDPFVAQKVVNQIKTRLKSKNPKISSIDYRLVNILLRDARGKKGHDGFREITPYGDNIFYISERFQESRKDAWYVIKEGEPYPTLKRRTWFFHEDGREFSLREYAQVQEFPDDFIFVGTKDEIKNQIGNAVPPPMARFVARRIPPSFSVNAFGGCGGMAHGFQQAGHTIVWMNEWDRYCCYTYRANFPSVRISRKDVRKVSIEEIKSKVSSEVQLVFGGPPCQGFSVSGFRFKDDPRNGMYKEFLRIVEGLSPRFFVMENVPGILTFKDQIIEDMERVGYKVNYETVKGEEIGMRQKRHRVFFFGEA